MESVTSMTTLQYLALIHQVSYTHVCKEVGLTPQQFSDWVKKRRPVPKERLQSLADYFQVEASLLVDDNGYLQDLSAEMKIEVQIRFLRNQLDNAEEGSDIEAYVDKLKQLELEKDQQLRIDRFAAMVRQSDERTIRLCDAFLEHFEHGDLSTLEDCLVRKEPE